MTEQQTEEQTEEQKALAESLQCYWDQMMEDFFDKVDRAREKTGLTDQQVEDALAHRYGWEVAEEWRDWAEGEE